MRTMARAGDGEQKRLREILDRLEEEYPDADCALYHESAFQLLLATILSAQCTDERVNKVTPELFERYPTPGALAAAAPEDVQEIIRSTGFFRNKAKSLIGASRKIVEDFDGKVPDRMPDLLELPGVARKTANVVLGTWFGKAKGVVVDTHVRRLSQRLGFTGEEDPKKIEKDLMDKVPREEWIALSHRLIRHGRRTCKSRSPRCEECFLPDLCVYYSEESAPS